MLESLRRWRRQRVLARYALPDALWGEALAALPFMALYDDVELARLRDKVVLFLESKAIVGARDHEVTPLARVLIAIQACVLVLNLDLALYDDFENVIVYEGEFVPGWEWEDDAGVVHVNADPMAGEAMPGGPVVLSWSDVEASTDWETAGMNLVIHEFAHKLDMLNGEANGCPPLPADVPADMWRDTLGAAFEHFRGRVACGDDTVIDPYASESPAEFFAVLSEVFFAEPALLAHEYPEVYQQFAMFYQQDPAARAGLVHEIT
jgi:Mlc titration factor MtfA (ptsG expression regulator)